MVNKKNNNNTLLVAALVVIAVFLAIKTPKNAQPQGGEQFSVNFYDQNGNPISSSKPLSALIGIGQQIASYVSLSVNVNNTGYGVSLTVNHPSSSDSAINASFSKLPSHVVSSGGSYSFETGASCSSRDDCSEYETCIAGTCKLPIGLFEPPSGQCHSKQFTVDIKSGFECGVYCQTPLGAMGKNNTCELKSTLAPDSFCDIDCGYPSDPDCPSEYAFHSIVSSQKDICCEANSLDLSAPVNIAFICTTTGCDSDKEDEWIAKFVSWGYTVAGKKYSSWTVDDLLSYDLMACTYYAGCSFAFDSASDPARIAFNDYGVGLLELCGVYAKAGYYLGFISQDIHSTYTSTMLEVVGNHPITSVFSGEFAVLSAGGNLDSIEDAVLSPAYTILNEAVTNTPNTFIADPAGTSGAYAYVGIEEGVLSINSNAETLMKRALAWTAGNKKCGTTVKIYPLEDSYVSNINPSVTYNTNMVYVKHGNELMRTFLKFNLMELPPWCSSPSSAKLTMYLPEVIGNPVGGGEVPKMYWGIYEVSSDSWNENTLTWANQPSIGNQIFDQPYDSNRFYEWDVSGFISSQVSGDKAASIELKASETLSSSYYQGVGFVSEEGVSESQKPYLTIVC